MKTLKIFKEVYAPKSPDENNFVRKHVVQKTPDKNGNKDEVFNGDNVKAVDRKATHHGYNPGDDEKVYEETIDKMSMTELDREHKRVQDKIDGAPASKRITKDHPWSQRLRAIKLHKMIKKQMSDEVENLDENAQDQYDHYHKQARELLKHLSNALDSHKESTKDHNSTLAVGVNRGAHWGHVGDIKDIKRNLEDIHDRLTQTGEYAKGGM
jgi:hypothetical protein